MDWRPIETAPKTGTVIRLYNKPTGISADGMWSSLSGQWWNNWWPVGQPDSAFTHWKPEPTPARWLPIDTAPTDGTRVLVCGGKDYDGATGPVVAHMDWRGRWLITEAEDGRVALCRSNPTHWMPLPELPTPPG
jgi:hypothetical protein